MPFVADALQNTSNALFNQFGIVTPELGLTESAGGSNVNPNHTLGGQYTGAVGSGLGDIGNLGSTFATGFGLIDPGQQQGGSAAANAAQARAVANNVAQYDSAIGQYQSALDRLGSQLGIAQGNINSQYNTSQNELNSSKAAQQNTYDTSSTQNQQNLRSNKNTINDQASQGLRGLLRTLGAYGAVGSDLGVAGGAVADQASQQRAGAGQTFAQNQQGLDTNWNTYLTDFGNQEKKLGDWRSQQLNSAEAQSQTSKQSILQQLADLRGQRAAASGGSYLGAAQPYLDQASSLNSSIDNLGRINPTYDGTTPVYSAPTLGSYLASANGNTSTSLAPTATNSPYLSLLLGQDRNKRII